MYITSTRQLDQFCQSIKNCDVIAVDTEFKRETTYFSQLCLVQIATDEQFAIIDPIKVKDISALKQLLLNPQIKKVLHSAHQDMEIFYHLFKQCPKNLFDTQIASNVLGLKQQISFKDMVSHFLGIEMDKSQTRSDWSKRPLSSRQLEYARYDVTYLIRSYRIIVQQLTKLGRLDWLKHDFLMLEQQSNYQADLANMWKKVKGHQQLGQDGLKHLLVLAAWREQIAIKQNRPRRRVLHDLCLINAANYDIAKNDIPDCLKTLFAKQQYALLYKQLAEQFKEAPVTTWQAVRLNQQEKTCLDNALQFIEQQSELLHIDLKDFISNRYLKKLIKKYQTVSNPCLIKPEENWLYYAVIKDLADKMWMCLNQKLE